MMGRFKKDTGKMASRMVGGELSLLMGICMKDISRTFCRMGKESSPGLMAKGMLGSGPLVSAKALGLTITKMGVGMKDSGVTANIMALENG